MFSSRINYIPFAVLLLAGYLTGNSDGFVLHVGQTTQPSRPAVANHPRSVPPSSTSISASNPPSVATEDLHPAVVGWPEKYGKAVVGGTYHPGPQILHNVFTVEAATPELLERLDVANWPTWTTSDKEKWAVGNQNPDKVMPYGELSYMISGRLEIIPQSTGQAVIVEPGDMVTFPKDFVASWRVLEEVTWHYFLY